MDNGFQFFDIILFAMIAGFLILRLRGVLGRRDGDDGSGHRDRSSGRGEADADAPDNVVPLRDRPSHDPIAPEQPDEADMREREDVASEAEVDPDDVLGQGILKIRRADPNFEPAQFVGGARVAFEIILEAFASGDKKTLKNLLAEDVFANFRDAIDEREKAGETLDETLVGIRTADIVEAYLEDDVAHVTVKFVSEQVTVTRDAEGEVVDGDPDHIATVTDFWTFARDTNSRDPNWTLVATGSLD